MRRLFLVATLAFLLNPSSPTTALQREPWPGSVPEGRLAKQMDPVQVQAIVDNLNEESKKRYSRTFIVKYYLELGPLNRVQVDPDLWKSLTRRDRRQLGNSFAMAFRGTGLLFCQFRAGDTTVGKIVADPIRGGLKFVAAD